MITVFHLTVMTWREVMMFGVYLGAGLTIGVYSIIFILNLATAIFTPRIKPTDDINA